MQSMTATPADIYTNHWRTPVFSNRQTLKERPRSGNHRRPYQQLFRFKEVLRKTGPSDLWNVFHKEDKVMLEHTTRLHTRKTLCHFFTHIFTYIFYAFTCIFYALSPRTVHIRLSNFILSHLKMMTWSHRNVVHNSFRLFLSRDFKTNMTCSLSILTMKSMNFSQSLSFPLWFFGKEWLVPSTA